MVRYMFSSKENVPVLLLKDDTVTAKHLYPLHSHRAFEISIIKQGTGNYLINDRIYDYEKAMYLLSAIAIAISYSLLKNSLLKI